MPYLLIATPRIGEALIAGPLYDLSDVEATIEELTEFHNPDGFDIQAIEVPISCYKSASC